jgi:hypothetical protein
VDALVKALALCVMSSAAHHIYPRFKFSSVIDLPFINFNPLLEINMSHYRDTFTPTNNSTPDRLPTKTNTTAITRAKALATGKPKRIRRYELPPHLAGTLLREPGETPYLHQAISDRLAFILPYGKNTTEYAHERALKRVARRIEQAIELQDCERQFIKSPRYRHNISLPLPSSSKNKRSVFIQIGALQSHRQRGDIRIDLNPARMTAEDVQYLHKFMRRLIGKREYRELMTQPFINVWHPAVDIEHLHLDHVLVTVSKVEHRTIFGKLLSVEGVWDIDEVDDQTGPADARPVGSISGAIISRRSNIAGSIETLNFGTEHSDYFTCVYSKNIEIVHRAVEAIARAGRLTKKPLLENAIRQLIRAKAEPSRVRIEVRGRKMRGVPLWALDKIGNRFEKIHFIDLADPASAPDIPASMRAACIAIYRDSGRKAVYTSFDGSKRLKEIQRWLDGDSDPAWWQPQRFWTEAIVDLQRKKLFPPDAWNADGQIWPPKKAKRKPKPKAKVKISIKTTGTPNALKVR